MRTEVYSAQVQNNLISEPLIEEVDRHRNLAIISSELQEKTDKSKRDPMRAVLEQLQFEVVQFHLAQEYSAETRLNPLPYSVARWEVDSWEALQKASRLFNAFATKDHWNCLVLLFKNQWDLEQIKADHPNLRLSTIALLPTAD